VTTTTESRTALPLEYQPAPQPRGGEHRAVVALLVATVFWGCGFTWAKAAGEAVHRVAGLPDGSLFGPIFILAWRFFLGGMLISIVIPAARAGWTWRGALRIAGVGLVLAAGLILQHVGLDRTSEAVSAFLTSLTVLFVPIILTVVVRRPPAPVMWLGVALATAGVWMMTGASPTGFGAGELLGLGCAFTFSLYILAVNSVAKTEDAWRMSAGQFLVVAAACAATAALVPGREHLRPDAAVRVVSSGPVVWANLLALVAFPTVGAFTLLNFFQPRLDPTHSALIYLMEPVIAAVYAFVFAGRTMHPLMLVGALLILAANVLVELLKGRDPKAN
jgi:drug/metabolite transporter (DMT)-like permease